MENKKISVNDVVLNNATVKEKLLQYVDRLMSYDYFDQDQLIRIYVDDALDFIAFESVKYRVQFTSNFKKLTSLKCSPYEPVVCPFSEFAQVLQQTI